MAESVPPDGKVLTIEHNSANADIAQGFFDRSPQGCKIALQRGEAIDVLKSLPPEATDLVFIDADNRVEKLFLTLRDGIYLIRKK